MYSKSMKLFTASVGPNLTGLVFRKEALFSAIQFMCQSDLLASINRVCSHKEQYYLFYLPHLSFPNRPRKRTATTSVFPSKLAGSNKRLRCMFRFLLGVQNCKEKDQNAYRYEQTHNIFVIPNTCLVKCTQCHLLLPSRAMYNNYSFTLRTTWYFQFVLPQLRPIRQNARIWAKPGDIHFDWQVKNFCDTETCTIFIRNLKEARRQNYMFTKQPLSQSKEAWRAVNQGNHSAKPNPPWKKAN